MTGETREGDKIPLREKSKEKIEEGATEMPNWIEGTIKLRGESENLRRFFSERIEAVPQENIEKCVERRYGDYNEVVIGEEVWIKESWRAFIQPCVISWEKERATVCAPIRQAWSFCGDDAMRSQWEEISKSSGLDIRLSGFESGAEFFEDAVIISGHVIADTIRKYNDWDWECPMPMMGG